VNSTEVGIHYTLPATSGAQQPTAAAQSTAGALVTTITSPNSPSSTPTSDTGSGSGGLSVGDIAGVVSAIIAVIGLIVAILTWRFPESIPYYGNRRRQKAKLPPQQSPEIKYSRSPQDEYSGYTE
jgi:hypothetical protein